MQNTKREVSELLSGTIPNAVLNVDEEKKKDTKKEEVIKSKWHSLYKINVPSKRVSKKNGFFKEKPAYTNYRVFIDDFMELETGLHAMWNALDEAGPKDRLELRINSHGGFVNEGAQLYNVAKNKFNGRVTTVLDNCGYSMGALTFCIGDKRIVNERADLMFHDYSGGNGGKGGEMAARQEHTAKFIRKYFYEVIVRPGFLTEKEFKNMIIGQDYWMDVIQLCERGIATHVLVGGKEIKAETYLKRLDADGIYDEPDKKKAKLKDLKKKLKK